MARKRKKRQAASAPPAETIHTRIAAAPESTSDCRALVYASIALFLLALGLRLLYIHQIRHIGFFDVPLSDAAVYDQRAEAIARGDLLGPADFVHAPLYAYVFGAVKAAGGDLLAMRLVQAVLGAASCVLVLLACRHFFNLWSAMMAGFLLAIYPPAIFFDGLIQKTSLALFLSAALLWIVARPSVRGSSGKMFAAGVILGLLILTRQNALAFAPVVLLWAWLAAKEISRLKCVLRVAACLGGLVLVLFPWGLRNHEVTGAWTLTTPNLGQNFAMGNNPEGTGTYLPFRRGRASGLYEQQEWTRAAEEATGRTLSPAEVSDYYLEAAMAYVRAEPVAWLKLMGKKILMVVNAYEAPDTEDYYVYQEWSPLLHGLDCVLHFGVLFPLAAIGVWLTRSRWRELWFLYAWLIVTTLAVAVFVVFARYRFPLMPVLAMFAGAAIVELVRVVRGRSIKRLGVAAAVAGLAALVANWPVHAERRPYPFSYTNHAIALGQARRYEEALAELDKALALSPDNVDGHFELASLLTDLGRTDEALEHFRVVQEGDPEYAPAWAGAGRALLAQRALDRARAAYRHALDLDPAYPQALNGLGQIAARRGHFNEAIELFGRAIDLDARFAPAQINLGNVYLAVGRANEAARAYRAALSIEPDNVDARYNYGVAQAMNGDANGAVNTFSAVLSSWPEHHEAQRALIMALIRAGRADEARAMIDRITAADPSRDDIAALRTMLPGASD